MCVYKRFMCLCYPNRACPGNYSCMPGVGSNPDHGYTSFDNMGWAMVMAFQILTMDFWENLYDRVIMQLIYINIFRY